ncbi:MAG: rhodanese-like domain-containing protein [Methanothrix sp.]|nr:rhodanese-like domain-containing protein [Methanothrix sp.]
MSRAALLIVLLAMASVLTSCAGAECAACSSASQQEALENEWAVFLGKAAPGAQAVSSTDGLVTPKLARQSRAESSHDQVQVDGSADLGTAVDPQQRSSSASSMLVPVDGLSGSEILIDISPESTEYIPGAISIPYTRFLESGGALRSISEMAQVLGESGVSPEDDVVIYGECQPCGGGPSAATYVYWIMKYLGHDRVRLLDGGIDDWVEARRPTEASPSNLSRKNYTPSLRPDLLATYEYVHSGAAQVVDARTAGEFASGAVPGAISIPYDSVLSGKRLKDEAELEEIFASLRKDRPVVVYTNTGVKASMVWFALTLLGYDARLYSWQDWQSNRPQLNIAVREARADPNPAKTGDAVQITVVFEEVNDSTQKGTTEANETRLTVKGCATCGFGSPQGFADLSSVDGVVQIGSASQAKRSAEEGGFKVTAVVKSQAGAEVSRVIMKRVSGDQFAGIWNANVAAGTYTVDISASLEEITKTFSDALRIDVVGTSKYKNLGSP